LILEKFDPAEIGRQFDKNEEELASMDETEFRARMRERCHHTLEIQVYGCIASGKKLSPTQTTTVDKFLSVWEKRGLSHELPEYRFAMTLRGFAEALYCGETVSLQKYAPTELGEADQRVFDRILHERRSVRHWDWDKKVPDEVIDKVLEAGLWGAHACNLQSIRYIVVREENAPNLFRNSDIPGGPVHILILQDTQVYRANPLMPAYNKLLDCGAAGQNVVLAAHACGLGGTWLTFTSDAMRKRIIEYLQIPDEYDMVTYVDVGYPAQTPCAPDRISVEEAVLKRV
jgi:nitroreductase